MNSPQVLWMNLQKKSCFVKKKESWNRHYSHWMLSKGTSDTRLYGAGKGLNRGCGHWGTRSCIALVGVGQANHYTPLPAATRVPFLFTSVKPFNYLLAVVTCFFSSSSVASHRAVKKKPQKKKDKKTQPKKKRKQEKKNDKNDVEKR